MADRLRVAAVVVALIALLVPPIAAAKKPKTRKIGGTLTLAANQLPHHPSFGSREAYRYSGLLTTRPVCLVGRTIQPMVSDNGGPFFQDLAHGGITDPLGNWATFPNQGVLFNHGHVYSIYAFAQKRILFRHGRKIVCKAVTSPTISLAPAPA